MYLSGYIEKQFRMSQMVFVWVIKQKLFWLNPMNASRHILQSYKKEMNVKLISNITSNVPL